MSTPYIDRLNTISRYKERKLGRNLLLFGRDVEVDANSRSNARQMFDGDLLVQPDLLVSCCSWIGAAHRQECALDYTFLTLGIDGPIQHPVVFSERLANPLFTRASQLLFC